MELHVMVVPVCALYLVFSSFVTTVVALNAEGFALLSFKAAMTEDPELAMGNWNSSDADPCSWSGIICKEGNVVSISLPKKGLLGYLPFSLGSLTSLRHINLRNNRLQGSLPAGLFAARSLQNLVLHANYLSGPLPPEIGNLLYLQILDLSHNSLESSIPVSMLHCQKLKILDLSHNNFSNSLPPDFGSSFPALQKFSIGYNRLNGSIPSGIGDLFGLRGTADLSHNQFSGAIPASLGNLPENVYINLAFNNLSGLIPQNGALVNRGPTAFVGNPGLCGPPLKNPCSSSAVAVSSPATLPTFPRTNHSHSAPEGYHRKSRALNRTVIISIVVADVVAVGLMATVFLYCYLRVIASKNREESERSLISRKNAKRCLSCLWKDGSDTISETVEQSDLIPLDKQVHFDLDELLKASAFILGRRGIGIVYRVILEDGLALAVRRLGGGELPKFKDFQMTVEAIGKVRHQNIVCLRAYYWSIEEKLLIYDYIPNGNLSTAIHGTIGSSSTSPLRWDIRLKIMKGVAKGLSFLHEFSSKKYIHGDLNPNNILLGLNMEPYISDFGLHHLANVAGGFPAMYMHKKENQNPQSSYPNVALGPISSNSFCYQAPEAAMKTAKPSQKWDVYSYGMILLEIISGRSPIVLRDNTNMDLVEWIQLQIGARNPIINVLDPFLARKSVRDEEFFKVLEIALDCVQANAERRPSMKHVAESLEMLTNANC